MKRSVFKMSLALLLGLVVSTSFLINNVSAKEAEITLVADFSKGDASGAANLRKTKKVLVESLSVENVAKALSAWTGLDFTLNKVTDSNGIITVDWSKQSTLLAGLDGRKQKDDFKFIDAEALNWFMLDSLLQSIQTSFEGKDIHYSMDGGKDLVVDTMYPYEIFPVSIMYMHSNFYYAHSDVVGDDEIPDEIKVTEGTWRLDNAKDTAYIVADGKGSFYAYYASGALEKEGYIDFIESDTVGDVVYNLNTSDGKIFATFSLRGNNEMFFPQKSLTRRYYKDLSVYNYDFPILTGGKGFEDSIPLKSLNDYRGGYLYESYSPNSMTSILNASFSSVIGVNENTQDYIMRTLQCMNDSEIRRIKIKQNYAYTEK